MPPWDAVRVLRVMMEAGGPGGGERNDVGGGSEKGTADGSEEVEGSEGAEVEGGESGRGEGGKGARKRAAPVAVAMHWGTFITDPEVEVFVSAHPSRALFV